MPEVHHQGLGESIFADFPNPSELSVAAAKQVSEQIRRETRPKLFAQMAGFNSGAKLNDAQKREALELGTRIEKLDAYAIEVDQFILQKEPPLPAQHWEPELNILGGDGKRYIEAEAPMFFSAESLSNVHGPVMLLHLATLAEELLQPGEVIVGLRKTAFKKLAIFQMRLYVCDDGVNFPDNIACLQEMATVAGKFVLSSGRLLTFFAVQLPEKPVTRFAHFNSFAMKLFPKGMKKDFVDGIYYMRLVPHVTEADIPSAGFTPPTALMTLLDIWMIMLMTIPRPEQTKLLLGIRELDIPDDIGRQLTSDITIECHPHFDRSRMMNSGVILLPIDFRLNGFDEAWRRIQMGLSIQPYYQLFDA